MSILGHGLDIFGGYVAKFPEGPSAAFHLYLDEIRTDSQILGNWSASFVRSANRKILQFEDFHGLQ
jgi:hypothetical protein